MATPQPVRARIRDLRQEYEALRGGKESLLAMIDDAEIPENTCASALTSPRRPSGWSR